MAPTIESIRDALGATEPDYPRLASEFGVDGMALLKNLVESGDVAIATKAIYLATMIGGSEAIDILQRAAELPNERIRVAVSAAAADLDPVAAAAILATLMKDEDGIVRGVALRSIKARQAIKDLFPGLTSLD